MNKKEESLQEIESERANNRQSQNHDSELNHERQI